MQQIKKKIYFMTILVLTFISLSGFKSKHSIFSGHSDNCGYREGAIMAFSNPITLSDSIYTEEELNTILSHNKLAKETSWFTFNEDFTVKSQDEGVFIEQYILSDGTTLYRAESDNKLDYFRDYKGNIYGVIDVCSEKNIWWLVKIKEDI